MCRPATRSLRCNPQRTTQSSSDPESPADGPRKSSPRRGCACCCSSAARTSSTSRTTSTRRRRRGSTPTAAVARRRWSGAIRCSSATIRSTRRTSISGRRRRIAVHRSQALRLVSRLSGGRPIAHVGALSYPLERLRLRGEREGRHRHRLADPLRRHRAMVRSRREARGDCRFAGGTAAAPRRRVPARHAAQLRRGAGRGSPDEAVQREAPHHPGPHREPDAAARRARARASIATPAGSAARTARTSARSRRRCRPR